MVMADALAQLTSFVAIIKANEPLAPHTVLKIGGPAEVLAQPRTPQELASLVQCCAQKQIPLRVLGGGGNLLVRDEGVRGVVVRLSAPAFTELAAQGKGVRAGAGATLAALISRAARSGLAGLETLVGIPGTVGGALRQNSSDRSVEIGQFVSTIEVLDAAGHPQIRARDELRFAYGNCNLDDPVFVAAEFDLEPDQAEAISKRMRKSWIQRKAAQPFSFQAAGRVFKNPAGLSAAALLDQAALVGTRVGGAQVSDRDANYIVAEPGTCARDVLRLIDLMRSRVQDRFHVDLELEISVW
jgi:UDP-N-acetylmuramate dehydrogenase